MSKPRELFDLAINLEDGVVPISKAASSLAALITRSRTQRTPIVVTQKGYPAAVILDVELYVVLRALASQAAAHDAPAAAAVDAALAQEVPPVALEPPADAEPAAPLQRPRGGRRRKDAQGE
jgi:prevent-host-death family protein